MMHSGEMTDEVIGDLAAISNKLKSYNLIRASEAVDDAMITVFSAISEDILSARAKASRNLPPYKYNLPN